MTQWLRTITRARTGWLAAGAFAVVGCGGPEETPVYPVSGRVVVDGKPAAGVRVTFAPVGPPVLSGNPVATTSSDGAFKLTSRTTDDGAPAGEYKVLLSWVVQVGGTVEDPKLRPLLPPKYAAADSTPLKATVAAAPTEVPAFEIKTK